MRVRGHGQESQVSARARGSGTTGGVDRQWQHSAEACPTRRDLHLIVDNYAVRKAPEVERWLKRHPRFHRYFTPTSASWLNMVERFFAEITRKRIRRGVFRSVVELQMAIDDFLEHHNSEPTPFVWTASASSIIEKVNRGKQALEPQH